MLEENSVLESILIVLFFILLIPFLILMILWSIVILPYTKYLDRKNKKEYAEFILQNEGQNYFCYNNRKLYQEYLINDLFPLLNKDIEIIYLDGKNILGDDTGFYSSIFYGFKKYKKFPHLFKIRNGKIEELSVNNYLFKCMNQGKDIKNLLNKIDAFFELNN